MSFSNNATTKRLAASLRQRNQRLSRASVDINADFAGRRISGDPKLDFANAERFVRF